MCGVISVVRGTGFAGWALCLLGLWPVAAVGLSLDKSASKVIGELTFHDCELNQDYRRRHVQCAYWSVPENPDKPGGTSIDLLVVRLAAGAARVAEDPVLAIAGGPGQAASESFLWFDKVFQSLSRSRDIYLIDQRGTGHSNRQHCERDDRAELWSDDDPAQLRRMTRECLKQFDGDPRQYTTANTVRDFEQVRKALALKAWNLYGVSYGTRVAQTYMRHYPEVVRTAVLDGVLPASEPLGPRIAVHSQAALDAFTEQCRAVEACRERFPDLAEEIATLFERLSEEPATGHYENIRDGGQRSYRFTRSDLVALVRMALYNSDVLSVLPPLLHRAQASGDFIALARLAERQDIADTIAMGLHNSVICSEDVPFLDEAEEAGSSSSTYMGDTMPASLRALCADWPRGAADKADREPLASSIPTLLLSGERDPVTPPAYGEQVAEGLENGRHLIVPGRGHHVGPQGCVPRLIARFVEHADSQAVEVDCLQRVHSAPLFINRNGPSP